MGIINGVEYPDIMDDTDQMYNLPDETPEESEWLKEKIAELDKKYLEK